MLEVTVTSRATKRVATVRVDGFDALTPKSAIAARNVAMGAGKAIVSDGRVTYYVMGNIAYKRTTQP